MKKIIKYICFCSVLFPFYSCVEKDLDLKSTQENATLYYKTDEQTSKALMAAYDPMGWVWRSGQWGASLKTWGNFASDDAITGGSDKNDQPTYQAADSYTVSPTDNGANLESFWTAYFMGIYRANVVLDNVEPNTPYKKGAIAQAKFLKSFYYFHLARMFGNIPILKKVTLADEITPQSTQKEVFAQIEIWLKEAIESGDLQERTNMTDPSNGLATKASAQALLGKVYLYDEKFPEAIEVLLPITTNTNYKLEPEYWKIFKGSNRHGIESIFEINFSNASGAGNEGNSDIYLMGPRGGVSYNDSILNGWGFNQPTQSLVDAFTEQSDNVRLQATVFFSDSLQAWYNKSLGVVTPIVWQPVDAKYWDRKHYPDPKNSIGAAYARFVNPDIILRLGDVYLMLAEAYVRTNAADKALPYINDLRKRAKLLTLGSVTLADVKKERRLELALEGDRYFDLVRWSKLGDADKIDANNVLGPLGYTTGTPGKETDGLFPIPDNEINSTYGPNKLIQNKGYN